jgi:hypothetical protein
MKKAKRKTKSPTSAVDEYIGLAAKAVDNLTVGTADADEKARRERRCTKAKAE